MRFSVPIYSTKLHFGLDFPKTGCTAECSTNYIQANYVCDLPKIL